MTLTLHESKGLNPKMMYCPVCKKDVGIVLLGAHDKKAVCSCGLTIYGVSSVDALKKQLHSMNKTKNMPVCPKCNRSARDFTIEKIGEYEKLFGDLCDECQAKRKEILDSTNEICKAGGLVFQCEKCGLMYGKTAEQEGIKELKEKLIADGKIKSATDSIVIQVPSCGCDEKDEEAKIEN